MPKKQASSLIITQTCPQCGMSPTYPLKFDESTMDQIGAFAHSGSRIHLVLFLESRGIQPYDAYFVAFHAVEQAGRCYRCNTKLAGSRIAICTKCLALNFDFLTPVFFH
jgi:hypothetical protein